MDRVRCGEIEVELDNLRALVPLVAKEDEERAHNLALSIGQYYFTVLFSRERRRRAVTLCGGPGHAFTRPGLVARHARTPAPPAW